MYYHEEGTDTAAPTSCGPVEVIYTSPTPMIFDSNEIVGQACADTENRSSEMAHSWVNHFSHRTDSDFVGFVNSSEEFEALKSSYEIETGTSFVATATHRCLGYSEIKSKGHQIQWLDAERDPHLPDHPYIVLLRCRYECHRGPDRNRCKKKKSCDARKKTDICDKSEHAYSRPTVGLQATKKLDCPAVIIAKEMAFFTDYQCSGVSKWKKNQRSLKIRAALEDESQDITIDRRIHVRLPQSFEHKNHLQGEGEEVKLPIDDRIRAKAKQLVLSGYQSVSEVKQLLETYVKEELFPPGKCPSLTSRRFFPSRRDVGNIIYSVKSRCLNVTIMGEQQLIPADHPLIFTIKTPKKEPAEVRPVTPEVDPVTAILEPVDGFDFGETCSDFYEAIPELPAEVHKTWDIATSEAVEAGKSSLRATFYQGQAQNGKSEYWCSQLEKVPQYLMKMPDFRRELAETRRNHSLELMQLAAKHLRVDEVRKEGRYNSLKNRVLMQSCRKMAKEEATAAVQGAENELINLLSTVKQNEEKLLEERQCKLQASPITLPDLIDPTQAKSHQQIQIRQQDLVEKGLSNQQGSKRSHQGQILTPYSQTLRGGGLKES